MGGLDLFCFAQRDPNVAEFLSKIPSELIAAGQLVSIPAGQVVVWQEDPVQYAYFLLSGELVTFGETEDGKKSSFITLDAPSVLSDLELLANIPNYASSVMAATDCTVLRCAAALVSRYLDTDLPFLRMTAALCNRKTYDSSFYRGKSAFRSSLDRAAIYLLRHCTQHPPEPGRPTAVPKTRQAIASELIMSVKTVDRCLLRLQEMNCLSIVRGKVRISPAQYALLTKTWGKGVKT